jgi:enoyl-CoA hydratase/carnithine racemase
VEITFDVQDRIGLVTINRPEKMNAINQAVRDGMKDIFDQVDADNNIKIVILRGAGVKAFSAGADLNEASSWTPFDRRRILKNTPSKVVRRCQKPVIAMIHGYAVGGGLELALGCDIRFASEKAIFSLPEVGLGWLPAGGGGTQLLPRTVGYGEAMLMILTSERFDAQTAYRIGLVQRLYQPEDLEEETLKVARKIAQHRTRALILAKSALQMAQQAPIDAGFGYELELNTICNMFDDLDEGIKAFKEKRTPRFNE